MDNEMPPKAQSRNKNRQYNLRLPDDLKAYLQQQADLRGVSLNQEITQRLSISKEQQDLMNGIQAGGVNELDSAIRQVLLMADSHWGLNDEIKEQLRRVAAAAAVTYFTS
ncbi:Arc family DNA-binding protein [Aeromonas veronii]|uniref:Arc family DNA-binding protein n=1 Tax=Aeromonas veronii TaxID=654 RepID=UPI000E099276|nr:Arc family DNA-binding protein [Aeromonas veronii]RDE61036.1 Arc family DNA-binding protein [Aeromonas veronii]